MIQLIGSLTLLLAALGASVPSWAQSYPVKPVRMILGISPGSNSDIGARLIGSQLEKRLGQPFIVENRAGANGTIAGKAVVNASPDGYTLFWGSASNLNPVLIKNNAVDAAKELTPVSNLFAVPYVLFVSAKQPFKSWQEVVAYAKANPGKANSGSTAFLTELLMNVLRSRAGITYTVIPYKGAAELANALISGDVDFALNVPNIFVSSVQAGTIRALFATRPFAQLPNVPVAAEVGVPDFNAAGNLGIWAPHGTPREIVQKLSSATAAAARAPDIAEQILKNFGGPALGTTPEEQLRTFESDVRFLREAARLSNFQPR